MINKSIRNIRVEDYGKQRNNVSKKVIDPFEHFTLEHLLEQ